VSAMIGAIAAKEAPQPHGMVSGDGPGHHGQRRSPGTG
jgi:hypothetical protein